MPEHMVLINFLVDSMGEPGLPSPRRRHHLERLLRENLAGTGLGECDGGGGGADGRADIFLYGPDADALWARIEGLVRPLLSNADAVVTLRYGDEGAREREVKLSDV